jgi:hypothetical protein
VTREQIIALIVATAHALGIEPWELLGGAIAESALDPSAWRQGAWPDWSAGLFQQTVRFAAEGDQSASPENVALIKRLYFDPTHACDVAARKFKGYRASEATALGAWCRYNSPNLDPQRNPNRANYARGLAEAAQDPGRQHASADATPILQQIIEWGRSKIGKPYAGPLSDFPNSDRFGGPGPHDGYDCSSFVSEAFKDRQQRGDHADAVHGRRVGAVRVGPEPAARRYRLLPLR